MNPFLARMGYGPDDRVLILHIDDMGFCHAANAASLTCLTEGSATCASILVNGPWFQEAAQMAKANPQLDLGVHLTLTAEYPTYRWPALSSRDPETGLLDADGYLWATREDAVRHVTVAAAEGEMRAQIDGALAAGIDVTHIDTHMGSVVHPKFLGSYLRLAREYNVPAFLPRITRDRLQALGEGDMADEFLQVLAMIDADQVPTLDEIIIETMVPKTSKHKFYRELIAGVQPGLTHLLFHPAVAGAELEAIADTHASRHADYEAFLDRSLRDFAEDLGIHLVGYRDLKAHLIA
ncbi:MAG: polysaccharide deacetylase family protein [Pseudomonadales bacterium]|nr:polysaccharide deacetylase family protein [Pseudomonadales bacterium]